MSQLSLCERWLEGALFLSLDSIAHLFEDLWVPVDDRVHFQNELRKLLDGWLTEDSYQSLDRGGLGYRVLEWFYGNPELVPELFGSWMRDILVVEGPDRPGETRWIPLSFRIARNFANQQGPNEAAFRQITAMVSFQQDKRAQLASKLEAIEEQEPTEWDARVLEVQDCSQDDVVTQVSLTAEYNIFLSAWEQHCADLDYPALYQLWLLGREVAGSMGMNEADIAFPGSWRFELIPFLRKFRSST